MTDDEHERPVPLDYCYAHGCVHTAGGYRPERCTEHLRYCAPHTLDLWASRALDRVLAEVLPMRPSVDPLGALPLLDALARRLPREASTVAAWARRDGATWADIGVALGMTRQGAHNRYGTLPAELDEDYRREVAEP